MRIAIIGFGYWGEIILKNLKNLKKIDYLGAVDIDKSKKAKVKKYQLDFFTDRQQIYKKVDACLIATWENTHYQLAKDCLLNKKHVLVEKPLALRFKEAQGLVKMAQKNNLILMIDNTFLFDKSFLIIKEKIDKGVIGKLLRIDSFRFSPNIVKPLTNVIIDLLPHDLAIFSDLISKKVKIISVNRQKLLNENDDNAHIVLKFGLVVTNSFLSWTYPFSRREMVFYGSKGVICWQKKDGNSDLLTFFKYQQKKLKFEKEIAIGQKDKTLNFVLEEFFNSIKNKKELRSSGKEILPQVKILEQVLRKI